MWDYCWIINTGVVMQTFLPYSDFIKSAKCLDYRRLGKQRVEAWQIYNTLKKGENYANWKT